MRISVYIQCFSCIALLCFPTAHDLVKSSFRASVLTMYALGFAFFMAHHTGSYSLQSVLVAHCFVDILLLSGFSLLCFRPILRNWKHYILLAGGFLSQFGRLFKPQHAKLTATTNCNSRPSTSTYIRFNCIKDSGQFPELSMPFQCRVSF